MFWFDARTAGACAGGTRRPGIAGRVADSDRGQAAGGAGFGGPRLGKRQVTSGIGRVVGPGSRPGMVRSPARGGSPRHIGASGKAQAAAAGLVRFQSQCAPEGGLGARSHRARARPHPGKGDRDQRQVRAAGFYIGTGALGSGGKSGRASGIPARQRSGESPPAGGPERREKTAGEDCLSQLGGGRRPLMLRFLQIANGLLFVYYLISNLIYLLLLGTAIFKNTWHRFRLGSLRLERLKSSPFTPPITLLVPAHNEEKFIVESVKSLLSLDYPSLEVIV